MCNQDEGLEQLELFETDGLRVMARLSGKKRSKLPKSSFALPSKRKYPIDTIARARNALARAAQKGTVGSYSTIRAKVLKRYPSLKKTKKG